MSHSHDIDINISIKDATYKQAKGTHKEKLKLRPCGHISVNRANKMTKTTWVIFVPF